MLSILAGIVLIISPLQDQDSTRNVVIDSVRIVGNEKTRLSIIQRELALHKGDTILRSQLSDKLTRTSQNLFNTNLFTSAKATPIFRDSAHVIVDIELKEAWYTWPIPIFQVVARNVNEWLETTDFKKVNYGLYLTQYNFRGRSETVSIGFTAGYTNAYLFSYNIPYIDQKQKQGLSITTAYSKNHEIVFNTVNNKLNYYRDNVNTVREQFDGGIRYSYRKGIYITHYVKLSYRQVFLNPNVIKLNPEYFNIGNTNKINFLSLSYYYRLDHRDIKPYPLTGYFFDIDFNKVGLGLVSNDLNSLFITSNLRKYWHLKDRFYYATAFNQKSGFTTNQSYYNQSALGYDDIVRGYEYYVINGQHYALLQSNLKYNIFKTHTTHLDWITPKFSTMPHTVFLNLFSDIGYVRDKKFFQQNPLTNNFLYSFGLGIDYITYYSTVIRLEYSIIKTGESGFFLHFTAPI